MSEDTFSHFTAQVMILRFLVKANTCFTSVFKVEVDVKVCLTRNIFDRMKRYAFYIKIQTQCGGLSL